jgi:hypothetical protein
MSEDLTTAVAAPEAAQTTNVDITEGYTGIPEIFRDNPAFEGKKVDDVLNEYLQQKEVLDTHEKNGLVRLPSEEAKAEEIEQFFKRLGKPETPAEYGFKAPEEWPEGLDYSDERAAKFAEMAHRHNLTATQAQGLFGDFHDMVRSEFAEGVAAQEDRLVANIETLEKVWGPADGEKFNQERANALRAFNTVADPDMVAQFKENPEIASNPLVLQTLARLGARMRSDSVPTLVDDIPRSSFSADSPAALDQAIKAFKDNGNFTKMINEPHTEAGKAARMEWDRLNNKRLSFSA